MSFLPNVRLRLFGLGPQDVAPVLAHFEGAAPIVKDRLTQVVESFVEGYHLGLGARDMGELEAGLSQHPLERRGFAYEGAGMGIALRVLMLPGKPLFAELLRGPGDPHHYMVQIGAGWAMARLGLRHGALKAQLDPSYHWLAWDGYGFHQAVFETQATVYGQAGRPSRGDYAGPAYDQGVGRALWFVHKAQPGVIAAEIGRFAAQRQADLWGGVGLAATYACGVGKPTLLELVALAGSHRAELGVGSVLAVLTRQRAGTPTPHLEDASRILSGMSLPEVASLYEREVRGAPPGDETYPRLRARIHRLMGEKP